MWVSPLCSMAPAEVLLFGMALSTHYTGPALPSVTNTYQNAPRSQVQHHHSTCACSFCKPSSPLLHSPYPCPQPRTSDSVCSIPLQEYTNYHFDVQPCALRGALERFSQFFVSPLLRPDALEREVCAVDSEFFDVLQSDHARQCQMLCHTVSRYS